MSLHARCQTFGPTLQAEFIAEALLENDQLQTTNNRLVSQTFLVAQCLNFCKGVASNENGREEHDSAADPLLGN